MENQKWQKKWFWKFGNPKNGSNLSILRKYLCRRVSLDFLLRSCLLFLFFLPKNYFTVSERLNVSILGCLRKTNLFFIILDYFLQNIVVKRDCRQLGSLIKLRKKQKIRQILYVSTSKRSETPHLNDLLTYLADFKTKAKIILKEVTRILDDSP